ncbi:hypothetical protein MHBO_000528 [Bonamia ostreae]|uniref:Acyltransferase 3 domain-containing protein n=1 Tax=Bonamia ostreae TaxID=126728 RepID=A0ABV2AH41_9EUKA
MQKSDLLSDTLTNREINGNYNLPFLKQHQTERNVLLDFIRGSSIYLVVLVHILLSIEQVLEQRDALSSSLKARLDLAFRQFIQFGMPLFFYVSGRSTAYTKSNLISGIIKKTVRLVPPLLFGMFFVVIPTQYLSKNFIPQKCSPSGDNSFLEYYKNYVFGINNYFSVCGFWWLWFIVVLYAVSVTNLPIVLEFLNPNFIFVKLVFCIDLKFWALFFEIVFLHKIVVLFVKLLSFGEIILQIFYFLLKLLFFEIAVFSKLLLFL